MRNAFLLLLIVVFATTVNSQTLDKKWGIGAGAGAYGTIKNGGIGIVPEAYLSRFLSPKFDLMLQGNFGAYNTKVESNLDFANVLLNLRYKLSDETKKLRPYLFAGPGLLADNSKKEFNFDLGLGAKYYFNTALAAYFEVGYLNGVNTPEGAKTINENFWKSTVGLEFDFGKAKDSDKDGVPDKKDKCPNTPSGVAVDKNGCPVDTDKDGVPDYMDNCPKVKGLISLKGCPDADKDGIADKDDACPNQAGPASTKGCPDKDGDGVADKNDKCPDTPKGVKVDASGCALDTDKDGIPDYMDDCPTVAGTKDNKGCPAKEAVKEVEKPKVITKEQVELQDIKVSPIRFESGKSNVTKAAKVTLDKMVNTINQNKDFSVNVYGYADSRGTDDLNMKLSQDRVDATIKYLESKGISSNRIIKQQAFGKTKPVASNDTEEGRLQNRRVEFEIFKMK